MGLAHPDPTKVDVYSARIVQSKAPPAPFALQRRISTNQSNHFLQPSTSTISGSVISLSWISLVLCALSIVSTLVLLMICFCVERSRKSQNAHRRSNGKTPATNDAVVGGLDKSLESIGSPSDLGVRTNGNSALYLVTPGSPESAPAMPMTKLSCESGVPAFTRSCSLSTQRSRRLPSSWFPWLVDKVRPGGGNTSSGSSSSGTNKRGSKMTRSAADSLVAAAVEDYQFASMRRLSDDKCMIESKSNTTLSGNPCYNTQMSRSSQHNRELPPVPSHETSPQPIEKRRTRSSTSSPAAEETANEEEAMSPTQAALAEMESLATYDSQYDLLLGTEALLMESAELRTNALACDCGQTHYNDGYRDDCQLVLSGDDASSCDDVDPFYSTIRRKQMGCHECGVPSVYTAAGSSRNSVASLEGDVAKAVGQGQGHHQHGTTTPNSHLYSKICRPANQSNAGNRSCLQQGPLSRSVMRRHQPIRSRAASYEGGPSVRPASSGPSLMREGLEALNRACMAPVVSGEDGGSDAGSLWSVSASQTTGTGGVSRPTLPSRGYGQSELDILHLLRGGIKDSEDDPMLPDIDDVAPVSPCCHHSNDNGQRRPSLHQLLLIKGAHRASQPALGSCSNLPILQPLGHTVTHFRQNSYSDHQLAPITGSPDVDENHPLQPPQFMESPKNVSQESPSAQQDMMTSHVARNQSVATSSVTDSDGLFSESLCQAEEEYADIYEALDNLDVANDNLSPGNNNGGSNNNNDFDSATAQSSMVTPATLAFVDKPRLVRPGFGCGTAGGKTVFSLLTYRAKLCSSLSTRPDENDNPLSLLRIRPSLDYSKLPYDDDAQLSPSILVEMKTFRHMDSDLDLSYQDQHQRLSCPSSSPLHYTHARPNQIVMTPLMERSMEGPDFHSSGGSSLTTTPPPMSSSSTVTAPPPPSLLNSHHLVMTTSVSNSSSSGVGSHSSNFRHSTTSSDMVMCDDSSPSPSSMSCTSNSPINHQQQDPVSATSSPVKIFEMSSRCPQVTVTAGRSPQR